MFHRKNKLYQRVKTLYNKFNDGVMFRLPFGYEGSRYSCIDYNEYRVFPTVLGNRCVYLTMFGEDPYDSYMITYYNGDSNQAKTLFCICVSREYTDIIAPKYYLSSHRPHQSGITVEEINNALLEIEEITSKLYEKLLADRNYHKEQELKLMNM